MDIRSLKITKRTHQQPIIDIIKRALDDVNLPYYLMSENDLSKRSYENMASWQSK
jgi:putative N-acetylmannosamine-6-phosphate epimerase